MAEPPQPGSMVRRESAEGALAPIESKRSLFAWLKLGAPSELAPALRVVLTFLEKVCAKQIEQIPALGPLLSTLQELSKEEDAKALEGRLTEILETGQQSRETLEALAALATAIYMEQRALREHLTAKGLAVEPQQITAVALSTALDAYRGRVARDFQYADHRGIEGGTRAEHAASLPLDEVYVLPRLLPERSGLESREREGRLLKDLLDNEDLPPAERSKLEEEFSLFTGERWRALKEKDQGLALGEALKPARQAVIIGSPGVGKSAMTRFLARTCALGPAAIHEKLGWEEDLLPIVLPLAAYADARSRRPGVTLREYFDARLVERGGEVLREAVDAEVSSGRTLILFDGVDEIPDSRERFFIVKAVDQFLTDHTASRVVVTSRPYGYVRLAGDIPHFQLPNFSSGQVEEFVHRWQGAFERWRHPASPDSAKAEKQAREMVEEIRRNPKVAELATNPLMLVIFALIRHEQARLPEERVQLYNRAVNTLMDSWNRGRCLEGIDVGGARLPLDRLVRVWSAVAEWTRRTKPTGVVHRAELKSKLIEILREEELDEENPTATAESYLNAAADRAGLLEERGKDIFAFWHPTFEEFLAAVELTTPSARATARLLPLRDDPRWREVILLAVGYLGIVQRDRESASELVRALWKDTPGPLEPLLHSRLLLAATCVADDVGVKRSVTEEVIVALAEVVRDFPYSGRFIESFAQTVRGVPRLRLSPVGLGKLVPLISSQSWKVRMESARLAGNVAGESAEALGLCEKILRDSYTWVRCHAAYGLLRAGKDSVDAWIALAEFRSFLAKLEKAVEEWLGTVPAPRILGALEPWLTSSDDNLRLKATQALGTLKREPARVLAALEPLLSSADANLRLQAAQILRYSKGEPAGVLAALEPLLTSSDHNLRLRAARTLSGSGGDPARVLTAVEPLLTSSDDNLRLQAAQTFSAYGGDPARVLAVVEPLLTSSDDNLRLEAGQTLMSSGGDPARVLAALESWLTSSDDNLRLQAAQTFSAYGGDPARVLAAVEPLLTSSDDNLRLQAAQTLGLRFYGEPALIRAAWKVRTGAEDGSDLEVLTKTVELDRAGPALAACEKLFAKPPVSWSDSEGRALADLTRVQPDDSDAQREIRSILFNWLWTRLQQAAGA
ncbi:MAG TPA: HEAT repeat domain-containing protein [Thermoanaerobaculia bacterium]|jgi:hypothetical protein|nr:HEAT repeat domain-containing protein [Thermoanaerobaculia bacterium]